MEAKISNLSLNPAPLSLPKGGKTKAPVADSWEEDAEESASDSDPSSEQATASNTLSHAQSASDYPSAPPPTPVSPTAGFPTWESSNLSVAGPRYPSGVNKESQRNLEDADRRRPEKSTATAGRLIAAGLGVKAPKQTEEQKMYERVTKENELTRRKREKEENERRKAEDERAKRDVWNS